MTVKVVNNFAKFRKEVKQKKAPMFINAVLDIIDQQSTYRAPIAYGKLVNSKFRSLTTVGGRLQGTLGFMANYALPLNGDGTYIPKWKPRPAPKYGNKKQGIPPAMGYNPQAKPGFLSDALESPEAQADLKKVIKVFAP
ncbi:neck protein [Pseudoalteromonas phage C7]|uniref:neck protein n=1 Tax=Pseudoalteromonas phage C7 TaxID=2510494 RepID=UPI00101879DB|nr:neck protein [Pseudoalteromonas phage C7]QAY17967.1 neck protein [Pseudoalteromonas phage C7]